MLAFIHLLSADLAGDCVRGSASGFCCFLVEAFFTSAQMDNGLLKSVANNLEGKNQTLKLEKNLKKPIPMLQGPSKIQLASLKKPFINRCSYIPSLLFK